jgi:DNA-binding transcriptional ArsR family regulator
VDHHKRDWDQFLHCVPFVMSLDGGRQSSSPAGSELKIGAGAHRTRILEGIDKLICQWQSQFTMSLEVIDEPEAAALALDPIRSRLLFELQKPASASDLAARLRMPRQQVNYHCRTLEAAGLVSVAETRKWGGLTERLVVAKAASFMISPKALGRIGADPALEVDRLSASYLIALAARVVREVSALIRAALEAKKHLATLSIDTVIRFRSAADRAAFTAELTSAINRLVARYHDESVAGGRSHRLLLMAHPVAEPSK